MEIGLALRSDRWVGADYWEQAADKTLTLDELLARSEVVVMGIDGGGLDDLLGLAVLGRDRENAAVAFVVASWAHQSVLERRKGEASVLRDFEEAGELRDRRRIWAGHRRHCSIGQARSMRKDCSMLWRSIHTV